MKTNSNKNQPRSNMTTMTSTTQHNESCHVVTSKNSPSQILIFYFFLNIEMLRFGTSYGGQKTERLFFHFYYFRSLNCK